MKRPYTTAAINGTQPADPAPANGPNGRPNGPGAPGHRTRRWERRPENRGYTYRVGADVDALLDHVVHTMADEAWICTKSQAARALIRAGFDAWDQGLVDVEGYPQPSGTSRSKAP